MENKFSAIGKKLSRLFLGRIVVRRIALCRETQPQVFTHEHPVKVGLLRSEPRVCAAKFFRWNNTKASPAGTLLGGALLKNFVVRSVNIGLQEKASVKRVRFRLKKKGAAHSGMWKMKKYPMMRRNRLHFLKPQPKFEKASLLALYSPLYQEKVKKSALDKSSGNLLFWYDNDRVKIGERYHLLLLRVFGSKEPLKWVWLPADKKIS